MRNAWTVVAVTGLAVASLGCAPRMEIVYGPRIEMSDLAAQVQPPDNGYVILNRQQTQGRFACSLAIAMFAPCVGPSPDRLELVAMHAADEAWWIEILRGVTEVQDTQFLTPESVRPETPSVDVLCKRAARRDAPLLLVFAPNRFGPNAAQVFGVIYDTASRTPLASLHAARTLHDDDGDEHAVDNEIGEHRGEDAVFRTRRQFEQHVLTALGELIAADRPEVAPESHQWRQPLEERWWLPRR